MHPMRRLGVIEMIDKKLFIIRISFPFPFSYGYKIILCIPPICGYKTVITLESYSYTLLIEIFINPFRMIREDKQSLRYRILVSP